MKDEQINPAQFDVLAKLLRSQPKPREGARLVLIEGKSNQEAMAATGLSPQALHQAIVRYRRADTEVRAAYASHQPKK